MKDLQTSLVGLWEDPANFVEPPSEINPYPDLSAQGRRIVLALKRDLEPELTDSAESSADSGSA